MSVLKNLSPWPMAASLLLVGCGATTGPEAAKGSQEPAATRQSFSALRGKDLALVELAQQTVRDRCLAESGFPQNEQIRVRERRDAFEPFLLSAAGFESRTEAEARVRGLGMSTPEEPARLVSYDPRYDKALDSCTRRAWSSLGERALNTYNGYVDVANRIMPAFGDEVTKRLARDIPGKMLACMSVEGFEVSDRKAFLMTPDPSTQFGVRMGRLTGAQDSWRPDPKRGGVQVGPPIPARTYVPTKAESDLAVEWWRCSGRTGRTADFRRASSAAQRVLMARFGRDLAELDTPLDEMVRKARELLRR